MTSILQTLGLGAPNPAAYSDASAVASQQAQAIGGLQTAVSSMNTAFTFAKTAGVSSSTLDSLQSLTAQANTLMSQAATMNPATLTTKTAALQSELTVVQFKTLTEKYEKTLSDTQAIASVISGRVTEVRADRTTSAGLLSQYDTLLSDVSGSLSLLLASPPVYTVSTAGSGSSYVVPSVPTDYQSRLDTLDGLKEQEEGTGYTFSRMWRNMKYWIYNYVFTALVGIFLFSCFILGGIISSNSYVVSEPMYLPNRIFYFVYGAIAFPISIFAACIKPPFWVAGLFPAYPRNPPTTLYGGATDILNKVLKEGLEAAQLIPKTDTAEEAAPIRAPAPTPTAPPPGTPFTESSTSISQPTAYDMFSYVLVDKNNVPAYQKKGKNTLWYLSLAHATGLIGLAVTYNFLPVIKKAMTSL